MEVGQVLRHRAEDVLKDVGAILRAKTHPPAPVIDEGSVQIDELFPGRRLIGLGAGQQIPDPIPTQFRVDDSIWRDTTAGWAHGFGWTSRPKDSIN